MQRALILCFLLWLPLALPLAHAEDSHNQMKLVQSATFLKRVQYIAWGEAATVLGEAHNTPCHTERFAFAVYVMNQPEASARQIALGISRSNAGGRVILGTVVDNADANLVDSSASDLALIAATQFYWNALSKCDTGS